MKKLLLILLCLPMIGFGQTTTTVRFIKAEIIKEAGGDILYGEKIDSIFQKKKEQYPRR